MLEVIYLFAVFIAAMNGALTAGCKNFDWIGTIFLAIVTALGGGTLRDILLNRTIFWIETPYYIWVAIVAAIVAVLYAGDRTPPMKLLLMFDAIGLAFFTILGAQVAQGYTTSLTIIILMALVTGVAGGLLRDVFANETPCLFQATESLYCITALAGALCFIFLNQIHVNAQATNIISTGVIIILRLLAIHYNARLPQVKIKPI